MLGLELSPTTYFEMGSLTGVKFRNVVTFGTKLRHIVTSIRTVDYKIMKSITRIVDTKIMNSPLQG